MTRPNVYIGIDPGTRCGWAVLSASGDRLASGAWDLGARRHEGGGMRFVRLRSYLSALLDAHPGAVLAWTERPDEYARRRAEGWTPPPWQSVDEGSQR